MLPNEQVAINQVLNYYEVIAVGFFNNALDKKIIKRYMEPILIEDFKNMKNYIKGVREKLGDRNICIEFERLHDKWLETPQ